MIKFKPLKESKYIKKSRRIMGKEWTAFIKKMSEIEQHTKIKPYNP